MYKTLDTDRLSWFRTQHKFLNYAEIKSVEDYNEAILNRDGSSPLSMLGNGSNCLFARKKIRTFLIKNKLPKTIEWKGKNLLWVSSSVPLMLILKECQKKSLESFYYLSSVPATAGGAIAMNAGRGAQYKKTIFDFVKCVDVWTPDGPISLASSEIYREHRHTVFLDHPDWFICGITFDFSTPLPPETLNPIAERVRYSQEAQDHSGPNCGSIFRVFHPKILSRLRGVGINGAIFSRKTNNWIINSSKSPRGVLLLICIARFFHFVFRKTCSVEVRIIE
jgi:UDP-N-acetylmuramate dehydrogenase